MLWINLMNHHCHGPKEIKIKLLLSRKEKGEEGGEVGGEVFT